MGKDSKKAHKFPKMQGISMDECQARLFEQGVVNINTEHHEIYEVIFPGKDYEELVKQHLVIIWNEQYPQLPYEKLKAFEEKEELFMEQLQQKRFEHELLYQKLNGFKQSANYVELVGMFGKHWDEAYIVAMLDEQDIRFKIAFPMIKENFEVFYAEFNNPNAFKETSTYKDIEDVKNAYLARIKVQGKPKRKRYTKV